MIFPLFASIVSVLKEPYRLFAHWVIYQKMQNFKGFQNLNSFFWDGMIRRGLKAKYWFSIIDPPPFVKGRSVTKSQFLNYWNRWFCREFFCASFETCPNSKRCVGTEKISKYYQNVKKAIFFENHKKWRIAIFAISHRYIRKI